MKQSNMYLQYLFNIIYLYIRTYFKLHYETIFYKYCCLSALVWVLKEQSSLPLAFKKKKSKYHQAFFQCKCVLNVEQ